MKRINAKFKILIFMIIISLACVSVGTYEHYKNRPLFIYLVRHGETNANLSGKLVGVSGNPKLTQKGIDDSKALGKGFLSSKIIFQKAYYSPQKRTLATLQNIYKGYGKELPSEQIKDLRDLNWGKGEGRYFSSLMTEYSVRSIEDCLGSTNDSTFQSPIQAETKYQYCKRFSRAIQKIHNENKYGGNVLVVTHSGMNFWLEKYFKDQIKGNNSIANDSVTLIKYDKNNRYQLIEYNNLAYVTKGYSME